MVKELFYKILKLTKIHRLVNKLNEIEHISNCNKGVINNGGKFYEEAKIGNASNNPSNIIIGNNTHIKAELLVFPYGGKINIGDNCYIGEDSRLWSGDSILIGNNVLISHNVNIMDNNAHEINHLERAQGFMNLIKYGHPKEKGSIKTAPIVIEDFAWINFNVTILRGVTIGKGAIIATGSLVTKNIPPFVLAGGSPAKIIKQIEIHT